ncbi:MAG TPA: type IV secretion system DNA-binding domain-containing protein [Candidatus Angelobacter sp.]|nr:type IV secretion system DNA-binding domain-containing protein [Candidatus Angelobacter sp.]
MSFLESLAAGIWNSLQRKAAEPRPKGLLLGREIIEEHLTPVPIVLLDSALLEHIWVVGTTGSGKTTLIRMSAQENIRRRRGIVYFDLHGDSVPVLLSTIAEEESRTGEDLSSRLILIQPADYEFSIGWNFLEQTTGQDAFMQIAEITAILKKRWALETSGPRTEELTRNSLYTLAANGLTLTEIRPFLTDPVFRAVCLEKVLDAEIRAYFETRYNQASDGMQAAIRDPLLSRAAALTVDPRFRHIVGQQRSTFNLLSALDAGSWIIVDLNKGRLGEQASTLGSLLLTKIKNALFARRTRAIVSLYADELQNLVTLDNSLETFLSESRKFGISVWAGHQYIDQLAPDMRAALQAVSTQIFFHLSPPDAERVAGFLDGGKQLAHLLKNLPHREIVTKSRTEAWKHAQVVNVRSPQADFSDLYRRARSRFARPRKQIEAEISGRVVRPGKTQGNLNEWE